jgi:HD-GYP domain-containing protein (c-di-GMP phosphodiesterase class II)
VRTLPWRAKGLVVATSTLTLGVLVVAALSNFSEHRTSLALLIAAAIVAEFCYVAGREEPIHPSAMHGFSFSTGIHLSAVFLIGPWEGATVAFLSAVLVDALRGYQLVKILYNGAVFALSTAAAGIAFAACGGSTAVFELPAAIPAVLASVGAYVVVNATLVAAIVGVVTDTPVLPTLFASVRAEASSTAAEVGAATAIVTLAQHSPWGLLSVIPLMLAAYQSHQRLALLQDETSEALLSLASLIDERDPYTFDHSQRVSQHVHRLGKALGLSATTVTRMKWAARVHDLGKVSLESSILHKPGRLDGVEWEQMRRHPRISARLIHGFRFARDLARVVEYHHERYDGEGYYGVDAADIPLGAHFLIVADTFDAMTTDRPYRQGLPTEEALAEIDRQAGTQFHPGVARAFVAMIRGDDPAAVLSSAELADLRRAAQPQRRPIRARLGVLRLQRERTMIAGALTTLLIGGAIANGPVLLFGAGLLGVGGALRVCDRCRLAALSSALEGTLDSPSVIPQCLRSLLGAMVPFVDVRWGAIVRSDERSLDIEVIVEDGVIDDRPSDAVLAGWLLQQTSASRTSSREASPPGSRSSFVAVPLGSAAERWGFLVIASDRRLPRFVQPALAAWGDRFCRTAPVVPLLRAAS